MGLQVKPRKDIVILAVAIEVFCVLMILWNLLSIFATIFTGNNDLVPLYVFQWIWTFLPIIMPILGIIGALRILLSLILIFMAFLVLFILWLILYVVLLFALDTSEHLANYIVNPIFIGINLLLAGVLLLLCTLFCIRVLQYRSNIDDTSLPVRSTGQLPSTFAVVRKDDDEKFGEEQKTVVTKSTECGEADD